MFMIFFNILLLTLQRKFSKYKLSTLIFPQRVVVFILCRTSSEQMAKSSRTRLLRAKKRKISIGETMRHLFFHLRRVLKVSENICRLCGFRVSHLDDKLPVCLSPPAANKIIFRFPVHVLLTPPSSSSASVLNRTSFNSSRLEIPDDLA